MLKAQEEISMSRKTSKERMTLYLVTFFYRLIRLVWSFFGKILSRISTTKSLLEFIPRSGDIFIVTYMRSGTTWMQMILYQLTSDGNMNFRYMEDLSPWFEMELDDVQKLDYLESPRFFKTHAPYKLVPKKWPVKYIYIIRNGMDVAVSQYYHLKSLFYPQLKFETSFEKYFIDCDFELERFKYYECGWFKHVAQWLENKNRLNILYLKYEDMSRDLEGCIRKVIDFCGLDVDESELPRILKRSSFDFMKKNEEKFGQRRNDGEPPSKNFIRKGKTDVGILYLNKNQQEMYVKKFDKYLSRLGLDSYDPRMINKN